jgi:Zn-dependent protease with chaperone function
MIPNLSDQLPHWVGWAVPVILPLVALIWLPLVQSINLRLFTEAVDPNAHWTERARRLAIRYRVWGVSGMLVLICSLLLGSQVVGPLQVISAKGMVVTMGTLLLVQFIWLYWRFNIRHQLPHNSLGRHFSLWIINLLVLYSYLPIAVLMAILIPSKGDGMVIGISVGLTLIFFGSYIFRLSMFRALGFVQAAPERLAEVVKRAAEKAGHQPKQVYLIDTRWANAYAYPLQNELMFSSKALQVLNDDELETIASHEIAHLKEGGTRLPLMFANYALYAVLGTWHPIVNQWGAPGMAIGIVLALALQKLAQPFTRDREHSADDHATHHVHDETVYARALENLYRFNLTPVVTDTRRFTHPDLYDRMEAAGLPPNYPRPEPANMNRPKRIQFFLVLILLTQGPLFTGLFSVVHIDTLAYETADDQWVNRALACGAGAAVLMKIGNELEDQPQQSAMYLTAASNIKPKWWRVRVDLAYTLEALERYEEAWQIWNEAALAHELSDNQSDEFAEMFREARQRLTN